ncbi:MAG TPA: PAS domain-containing protein [Firmicutes bacterium]|nr:PAS domain-containing protein [Bacillota bacterium]
MRSSLGGRMLGAYIVFVLPLLVAGLAFDVAGRSMLAEDVRAADMALAQALARETEARLRSAMQAVEQVALLSAVRHIDPDLLEVVAPSSMAARTDIDLFYVLNPRGKMIFSVPRSPATMGADFSFRKYFRDAIESPRPVVSDGRISPTTDRAVATVAYRMLDADGKLIGVMCTNLLLSELTGGITAAAGQESGRHQGLGRGVSVSIVDASGYILAHSHVKGALLKKATAVIPGLDPAKAAQGGVEIAQGADGQEWLLSYAPIPVAGWTVVVQHSAREAFASARYFHQGLLGALAFLSAGGCLFWFFLSRKVLIPLSCLSALARGQNTWEDPCPRGALARRDEIGGLAVSLQRMQAEYGRLYEDSLARERSRLEAIVESMSEGLLLENNSQEIVYANRAACRLLNASSEQLLGRHVPEVVNELGQREGGPRDLAVRCFEVTAGEEPVGRGYLVQDVTREKELDRMRESLVSTVAHELRTPLATIKGYASTLLQEDVSWDAESQRRFLRFIDEQASELAVLVNSLLDLSRLRAGALRLTRDWCHLRQLVDRALERLAGLAATHQLEVNIPADLPLLFVDGRRIEQVLRNLVENALKYSPPRGKVTVVASQDGGAVLVCVRDEGPGIPSQHLDRVFEPFYRVDEGLRRDQGGAGLGLAISKGFVEAHGGAIRVESNAAGTTFSFSLPLVPSGMSAP